jgi:hypothetical protein
VKLASHFTSLVSPRAAGCSGRGIGAQKAGPSHCRFSRERCPLLDRDPHSLAPIPLSQLGCGLFVRVTNEDSTLIGLLCFECGCTGNPRALGCFVVCQPARQGNGDKGMGTRLRGRSLSRYSPLRSQRCRWALLCFGTALPGDVVRLPWPG